MKLLRGTIIMNFIVEITETAIVLEIPSYGLKKYIHISLF